MTNYAGHVGMLITILFQFYIVGLIFVFGAQLNAFFFEQIQALPMSIGNCLNGLTDQESTRLMDGNNIGDMPTMNSVFMS
jgi:uncharacterized BrkB/YihY/UPF0761 family membrane protein